MYKHNNPQQLHKKDKNINFLSKNIVGITLALAYGIAAVLAFYRAFDTVTPNNGFAAEYIIAALVFIMLSVINLILFSEKFLFKDN